MSFLFLNSILRLIQFTRTFVGSLTPIPHPGKWSNLTFHFPRNDRSWTFLTVGGHLKQVCMVVFCRRPSRRPPAPNRLRPESPVAYVFGWVEMCKKDPKHMLIWRNPIFGVALLLNGYWGAVAEILGAEVLLDASPADIGTITETIRNVSLKDVVS